MPYSDPEQEKAFQVEYRKANAERRKAYDREYYLKFTKPMRQAARDEREAAKGDRRKKGRA